MTFALGFASGVVACIVVMYLVLVYLDRRDSRPPTEPDVDERRLKESADRLYGGSQPTCFHCGATKWVNLDTRLCETCSASFP